MPLPSPLHLPPPPPAPTPPAGHPDTGRTKTGSLGCTEPAPPARPRPRVTPTPGSQRAGSTQTPSPSSAAACPTEERTGRGLQASAPPTLGALHVWPGPTVGGAGTRRLRGGRACPSLRGHGQGIQCRGELLVLSCLELGRCPQYPDLAPWAPSTSPPRTHQGTGPVGTEATGVIENPGFMHK